MDLNAKLNFNVVSVDQGETVHLMLELAAPELAGERRRDPARLQIVLDRSGSMGDGRLGSALLAIDRLVDRLHEKDRVGLVAFDDSVTVPVAAGPVGDGNGIRQAVQQIRPGGMTNLSAGLIRGLQESLRGDDPEATTLVLLSDGHANGGITDHSKLGALAKTAMKRQITISTVGIGRGYDEDLLEVLSREGGGNSHFAETGDDAGAQLASEVDGLLEQAVQAASLTCRPSDEVASVRLFNDLSSTALPDGFMTELGDLSSGEKRKLLFEIDVPAIESLGLAKVCDFEVRWVDTDTMESQVAKIPVHVNVVPGDEAAGRIQNTEVETELTFQRVQRSKREAADRISDGDINGAQDILGASSAMLSSLDIDCLDEDSRRDIREEISMLDSLSQEAERDSNLARKRSQADYHRKARRRGREER